MECSDQAPCPDLLQIPQDNTDAIVSKAVDLWRTHCGTPAHSVWELSWLVRDSCGKKKETFEKTFYHPSPILVWCSSLTLWYKDAIKAWRPICKYFSINTDGMKIFSGGVMMSSEVLLVHPATVFWLHSVLSCFCRNKPDSWSKVNRFTCN